MVSGGHHKDSEFVFSSWALQATTCLPPIPAEFSGVPAAAGIIHSRCLLGPLPQVAVAPLDLSDVGGAPAMTGLCAAHK